MNRSGLSDGHLAMLISGVGTDPWVLFAQLRKATPSIRFPQAMILIVLAAVGFLACAFFLFVLFQWTRDTKRRTTGVGDAAGDSSEKKLPHVVGSQRTVKKRDRFSRRSQRTQRGGNRVVAGLNAASASVLRTGESPGR